MDLNGRPEPARHPRVDLLSEEQLTQDQGELYRTITGGPRKTQASTVPMADSHGRLLGPFGLMLLAPAIGMEVQELGAALRFRGRLSAFSRELVILTVAAAKSSEFEWAAHEPAGLSAGLTVRQLQAVLDGATVPGLSETDECLVAATRQLLAFEDLDDDVFQKASEVLDEEVLAELIWLVGYYRMLALALTVFAPLNPLNPFNQLKEH